MMNISKRTLASVPLPDIHCVISLRAFDYEEADGVWFSSFNVR